MIFINFAELFHNYKIFAIIGLVAIVTVVGEKGR